MQNIGTPENWAEFGKFLLFIVVFVAALLLPSFAFATLTDRLYGKPFIGFWGYAIVFSLAVLFLATSGA